MAYLLQASKLYSKSHSCRSSDLVRASSLDASALVLDETVQHFLTEPPYIARLTRRTKNFPQDSPSVRDVEHIVKRITDLLQSGGHANLFCTDHKFASRHIFFCVQKLAHSDGSSPPSASTLRDLFVVSAAPFISVDNFSLHCSTLLRESRTRFFASTNNALLVKRINFGSQSKKKNELQVFRVCKIR